jgi:hypothetical protein
MGSGETPTEKPLLHIAMLALLLRGGPQARPSWCAREGAFVPLVRKDELMRITS